MADDPPYEIGYGRPPKRTQFQPGICPNTRGRPRGRNKPLPYDTVLGREATIVEDGVRKKVTADVAFLHYLINEGLANDGPLRSLALRALQKPQATTTKPKTQFVVYTCYAQDGEVDKPMRNLGMAHLLDSYRPTAKLVIEPWLVQAALARLGDRRLTTAEQETIVAATRKPHKVQWPEWWEVRTF